MTKTYPQSLRQAVTFLRANPLVCLQTGYKDTICRSHWWFTGQRAGALWFAAGPPGSRHLYETRYSAHTGLQMHGCEDEVGLDFDARGFEYIRGRISIRVDYVDGQVRPGQ